MICHGNESIVHLVPVHVKQFLNRFVKQQGFHGGAMLVCFLRLGDATVYIDSALLMFRRLANFRFYIHLY
jgi:hypothetical protein